MKSKLYDITIAAVIRVAFLALAIFFSCWLPPSAFAQDGKGGEAKPDRFVPLFFFTWVDAGTGVTADQAVTMWTDYCRSLNPEAKSYVRMGQARMSSDWTADVMQFICYLEPKQST